MSDEITDQPNPVVQVEPPAERMEDYPLDSLAPSYPWQMTVAGVLWIMLGAVTLCFSGVMAALSMVHNNGAPTRGLITWLGFLCLFGAALLIFGIRVIRGTMRKLVSNMIISGAIGLYDIGWVVMKITGLQLARPNIGLIILIGFQALTGLLLLTAGILAFFGKSQYEQWSKTGKPDSFKRPRFAGANPCVGVERLLKEGPANLFRGWEGVGGWLFLTDQRLIFRPHRFNFQKQEKTKYNLKKDELSIPLGEIGEVVASKLPILIPTGMQVMTSLGLRKFVVNGRRAWIEAIEDAKPFRS